MLKIGFQTVHQEIFPSFEHKRTQLLFQLLMMINQILPCHAILSTNLGKYHGNLLFSVKGLSSSLLNLVLCLLGRRWVAWSGPNPQMPNAPLPLKQACCCGFRLQFGHSLLSFSACHHSYLWAHCLIWSEIMACMAPFTYCQFVICDY